MRKSRRCEWRRLCGSRELLDLPFTALSNGQRRIARAVMKALELLWMSR